MDIGTIVDNLKDRPTVHSIILFGSRARDEADEESDTDICLIAPPGKEPGLDTLLELGRDLPEAIDLHFFHELPINLRSRVLSDGRILYTEDREYVFRLIKETAMEKPRYDRFLEMYHQEAMERARGKVKSDG